MAKIVIEIKKKFERVYVARIAQKEGICIAEQDSIQIRGTQPGETRSRAVGNLILSHPQLFDIEIIDD